MNALSVYLAIGLGGGLGACSRYALSLLFTQRLVSNFPWPTLLVNLLGGLAIGVLFVVLQEKFAADTWLKPLLITGFLGGLTTFSTFSLETVQLLQTGQFLFAFLYSVLSVILCVGACFLMIVISQSLIGS